MHYRLVRPLEKQTEMREAFMSIHSLYEQSVWRYNYFLKINPKSNSISIVQINKILWSNLLDLHDCNRERGFKSSLQEL